MKNKEKIIFPPLKYRSPRGKEERFRQWTVHSVAGEEYCPRKSWGDQAGGGLLSPCQVTDPGVPPDWTYSENVDHINTHEPKQCEVKIVVTAGIHRRKFYLPPNTIKAN